MMNSLILLVLLLPTLAYTSCTSGFPPQCTTGFVGCICDITDDTDCSLSAAFDFCDTWGGGTISLHDTYVEVDTTIQVYEGITLSGGASGDIVIKLTDSTERIFTINNGGELTVDNTGTSYRLIFKGTKDDTGASPGVGNGGLIKVKSGGTLTMNCDEYNSTTPNCRFNTHWVTSRGSALYVIDGGTFNGDYVHFKDLDDYAFYFAGTTASDYTLTNSKFLSNGDGDIIYSDITTSSTSYCTETCSGDYTIIAGNLPSLTSDV